MREQRKFLKKTYNKPELKNHGSIEKITEAKRTRPQIDASQKYSY